MVGDVFGPAVAALTLGPYRRAELTRRMGRNSAFDHAGNVAIAAVAGAVGWALSQRAVFLLVPVFAALAAAAVLSIPAGAIDHQRARGAELKTTEMDGAAAPRGWRYCSDAVRCSSMPVVPCCSTSRTRRSCRSSGRSSRWRSGIGQRR